MRDEFVERVIEVLAQSKDWPTAQARLARLAHVEHTWDSGTTLYDQAWEHPRIAQRERGLKDKRGRYKGSAILASSFYMLYQLKPKHAADLPRLAREEPLKFVIGRVGNTATYVIRPRSAAERGQLSLSLGGKRRGGSGGDLGFVRDALARYGATLDEAAHIVRRDGKPTAARVEVKGGRLRVVGEAPAGLLFSGSPTAAAVASFVERFWFWTPLDGPRRGGKGRAPLLVGGPYVLWVWSPAAHGWNQSHGYHDQLDAIDRARELIDAGRRAKVTFHGEQIFPAAPRHHAMNRPGGKGRVASGRPVTARSALNPSTTLEIERRGRGLVWAAYDQNDEELAREEYDAVPAADRLAGDVTSYLGLMPPLAPVRVARLLARLGIGAAGGGKQRAARDVGTLAAAVRKLVR